MSNRPLIGEWYPEPDQEYPELHVSIPGVGVFEGGILPDKAGSKRISTLFFEVADGSRGNGAGTSLMAGALVLAKSLGIEYTSAQVDSPAALRIRQKLFRGNMVISPVSPHAPPLPITADQAIAHLSGAEPLAFPTLGPDHSLIVKSDLSYLHTDGWIINLIDGEVPGPHEPSTPSFRWEIYPPA